MKKRKRIIVDSEEDEVAVSEPVKQNDPAKKTSGRGRKKPTASTPTAAKAKRSSRSRKKEQSEEAEEGAEEETQQPVRAKKEKERVSLDHLGGAPIDAGTIAISMLKPTKNLTLQVVRSAPGFVIQDELSRWLASLQRAGSLLRVLQDLFASSEASHKKKQKKKSATRKEEAAEESTEEGKRLARLLGYHPKDIPSGRAKAMALFVALTAMERSTKYDKGAIDAAMRQLQRLSADVEAEEEEEDEEEEGEARTGWQREQVEELVDRLSKEDGVDGRHLRLAPHEAPDIEFVVLDAGDGPFASDIQALIWAEEEEEEAEEKTEEGINKEKKDKGKGTEEARGVVVEESIKRKDQTVMDGRVVWSTQAFIDEMKVVSNNPLLSFAITGHMKRLRRGRVRPPVEVPLPTPKKRQDEREEAEGSEDVDHHQQKRFQRQQELNPAVLYFPHAFATTKVKKEEQMFWAAKRTRWIRWNDLVKQLQHEDRCFEIFVEAPDVVLEDGKEEKGRRTDRSILVCGPIFDHGGPMDAEFVECSSNANGKPRLSSATMFSIAQKNVRRMADPLLQAFLFHDLCRQKGSGLQQHYGGRGGLQDYHHPMVATLRRLLLVVAMEDAALTALTGWVMWEMLAIQAGHHPSYQEYDLMLRLSAFLVTVKAAPPAWNDNSLQSTSVEPEVANLQTVLDGHTAPLRQRDDEGKEASGSSFDAKLVAALSLMVLQAFPAMAGDRRMFSAVTEMLLPASSSSSSPNGKKRKTKTSADITLSFAYQLVAVSNDDLSNIDLPELKVLNQGVELGYLSQSEGHRLVALPALLYGTGCFHCNMDTPFLLALKQRLAFHISQQSKTGTSKQTHYLQHVVRSIWNNASSINVRTHAITNEDDLLIRVYGKKTTDKLIKQMLESAMVVKFPSMASLASFVVAPSLSPLSLAETSNDVSLPLADRLLGSARTQLLWDAMVSTVFAEGWGFNAEIDESFGRGKKERNAKQRKEEEKSDGVENDHEEEEQEKQDLLMKMGAGKEPKCYIYGKHRAKEEWTILITDKEGATVAKLSVSQALRMGVPRFVLQKLGLLKPSASEEMILEEKEKEAEETEQLDMEPTIPNGVSEGELAKVVTSALMCFGMPQFMPKKIYFQPGWHKGNDPSIPWEQATTGKKARKESGEEETEDQVWVKLTHFVPSGTWRAAVEVKRESLVGTLSGGPTQRKLFSGKKSGEESDRSFHQADFVLKDLKEKLWAYKLWKVLQEDNDKDGGSSSTTNMDIVAVMQGIKQQTLKESFFIDSKFSPQTLHHELQSAVSPNAGTECWITPLTALTKKLRLLNGPDLLFQGYNRGGSFTAGNKEEEADMASVSGGPEEPLMVNLLVLLSSYANWIYPVRPHHWRIRKDDTLPATFVPYLVDILEVTLDLILSHEASSSSSSWLVSPEPPMPAALSEERVAPANVMWSHVKDALALAQRNGRTAHDYQVTTLKEMCCKSFQLLNSGCMGSGKTFTTLLAMKALAEAVGRSNAAFMVLVGRNIASVWEEEATGAAGLFLEKGSSEEEEESEDDGQSMITEASSCWRVFTLTPKNQQDLGRAFAETREAGKIPLILCEYDHLKRCTSCASLDGGAAKKSKKTATASKNSRRQKAETIFPPRSPLNVFWTAVVFDEAHHLRNLDTQRSSAVLRLRSRLWLSLTGTPINNDHTELYSLFQIGRYEVHGHPTYGVKRDNPQSLRAMLEERLSFSSPVHREPSLELPPLVASLSPSAKKEYRRLLADIRRKEGCSSSAQALLHHIPLLMERVEEHSNKLQLLQQFMQEHVLNDEERAREVANDPIRKAIFERRVGDLSPEQLEEAVQRGDLVLSLMEAELFFQQSQQSSQAVVEAHGRNDLKTLTLLWLEKHLHKTKKQRTNSKTKSGAAATKEAQLLNNAFRAQTPMLTRNAKVLLFVNTKKQQAAVIESLGCDIAIPLHTYHDVERFKQMDVSNNNKKKKQKGSTGARIGVGLYTKIGEGLNVQFVEMVVFYSLQPNPAKHIQAEARVNRQGQMQRVKTVCFYTGGTIDQRMYEILLRKANQIYYMVGGSALLEVPKFVEEVLLQDEEEEQEED
ncbi:Helicase [Balamuthia mandrillaris]